MGQQDELTLQISAIIHKATRSLAAARKLTQTGDNDFASSRAYYTVLYAMQAVLLTKNLSPAKHSAAIHLFNQHFIKTDLFPKEFGKLIGDSFRHRQIGDYTFGPQIDHATAEQDIQTAATVLQAIITYLVKEGFLPHQE
ncbi:MAG: HEPN domain-containing protein [Anaerolineae bacterium]|nr:HEPN domain-containing protein [Anaerolineae bacterium]